MTSSHPVPEQRGTEDLLAAGVGQYLHDPSRFAFFDGTADAGHRAVSIRAGLPRPFTSASVIPALPSGGSI
jgi:hypothetical protein